jgi:hypothetical protein
MSFLSQSKFEELISVKGAKILEMKKDARLTLRVRSDLKKEVEGIAKGEGHSVAQICEAFLLAGADAYKKQGGKFVKRALARLITKSSAD